jgi:hypothetical protein
MVHTDGEPTIAMKESDSIATDPVPTEIWEEIEEVWRDFRLSEDVECEDWCKSEGLDGLMDIKKGKAVNDILHLSATDPDPRVTCLTSYITGIRTGMAVARKRENGSK